MIKESTSKNLTDTQGYLDGCKNVIRIKEREIEELQLQAEKMNFENTKSLIQLSLM